ncbi:MAG: hypothetical protein GTO03_05910 [Planctomycetales bacterium]|nr:hypothetical protein [Planctomycetales bacterium]
MTFSLTYLPLIALSVASLPVEVQQLDGTTVAGRLTHFTTPSLSLQLPEGSTEIPLEQIQKITFPNQTTPPQGEGRAWVRLVDGSLLVASAYTSAGNQAQVVLADGTQLQFETRHVRSVRFHSQNDQQRRQWKDILRTPVRSDLIAIRKEERIDSLEGVLGDVDTEAVQFQLDDERIPVRRGKVEGIVYFRGSRDGLPPPVVRVQDIYGSQLVVNQWSAEGDQVRFQLPTGLTILRKLDQLSQVDFSSEKVIYLSDLEPVSVDWQPYLDQPSLLAALRNFFRPRPDRALTAGQLEGDDGKLRLWMGHQGKSVAQPFEKGLALHSRTVVTYLCPEDAQYFRALAGIDARVRRHGHVRLVLTGDQRELFAEEISGDQPPREIALPIAGVRLLEILVDFGDNQDIGDHLNLCNARFIK